MLLSRAQLRQDESVAAYAQSILFFFHFFIDPRRAVFWACICSVVSFASTTKTMAPSATVPVAKSSRIIRSVSATGNILIISYGRPSPSSR